MKYFLPVQRFVLALAVLGFAANARGGVIEFGSTTADPNDLGSANTGAYGSDANVSVGYSAYTYNWTPGGYGGLDGGTGIGVYSDNNAETLVMTFTAATGYTVTLDSFDLAQYTTSVEMVNISVTGGTPAYSLTAQTPAGGGTNYTTYSPDVTGTALTLTVTNLYDVGINEITYSETAVAGVPEPSTSLMVATACGLLLLGAIWRRKQANKAA
jgi:hypothetical protein